MVSALLALGLVGGASASDDKQEGMSGMSGMAGEKQEGMSGMSGNDELDDENEFLKKKD